VVPGLPVHVVQRGNNRQAVFFADSDYRLYLDSLCSAAARDDCVVHAYVLMTNHVHLLVTPGTAQSLSQFMQSVGRRYVRYINGIYKRTGMIKRVRLDLIKRVRLD
jgi:putative transposase